jgi:hypothetical protein
MPTSHGELVDDNAQAAVTTDIAEYKQTDAALAILRDRYGNRTFAVDTVDGMKEAIAARKEVRGYRTGLEKTRVTVKAEALAYCNKVDAEAKRIRIELEAIENPIDEAIKAEEERVELARQEYERERAARLAEQAQRIADFRNAPLDFIGASSEAIEARLAAFGDADMEGFDDENLALALTTRDDAERQLRGMLTTARMSESAAKVLAEREAELAIQRAEQDKLAEQQLAEQKRLDDEREAIRAEELRIAEDRRQAEQAELAELREQQAERERLANVEAQRAEKARTFIRTLREAPLAYTGASSRAILNGIQQLELAATDAESLTEDEQGAAEDAKHAAMAKLRDMQGLAALREQEAADAAENERLRNEQAQRDAAQREADRRELERLERERQEREEASAIEKATLFDAALAGFDLLVELGQRDHLVTRTLNSVLCREPFIARPTKPARKPAAKKATT